MTTPIAPSSRICAPRCTTRAGRIDTTLLVERLNTAGHFEMIGGASYLADVLRSVPTAANATYYAEIVKSKATLRALIHTSTEILRDAYDASADPREMLGNAEQKIFSILDERGSGQAANIRDILQEAMVRIDARMKHEHTIGGIETGFTDFDSLTGGLHDSELIILAARPSMGKTALAARTSPNTWPYNSASARCLSAWKCRPSNWPTACFVPGPK